MEIKKNSVSANKYVKSFSVPVLSETETIVPDNNPDLLKIIDISADIKTFNKSENDSGVSVAGSIFYTVIYIPESTNGVSVMHTVSAFSHSEECGNAAGENFIGVKPVIEHVEFNVLNSRKISVKAIVNLNFDITGKTHLSLTDNIDGDDIETSAVNFKVLNRLTQKSCSVNINEQVSLSPEKPVIDTIVKSNAEIFNKDIKVIANKAVVKGDLIVHILYISADGRLCVSENTLPFTEILDAEGINEESITRIDLSISDFGINAVGDSGGDLRMLAVNLNIKAEISGDEINTHETVNDAYSTSYKLSLDTAEEEIDEFKERLCVKSTLKESISAGENEIADIYSVSAVPVSVSAKEYDGGKTIVKGDMNISVLYITKNPDVPVYTAKTEIPFEINMPSNDSYDILSPVVNTDNICYNFSDGDVDVKIDMTAELMCFNRRRINIINSAAEEAFSDGYVPSIVLYFVQKNDTLWDIAKRYHTKTNYIEDLNRLDGELCEGRQLLIPKS